MELNRRIVLSAVTIAASLIANLPAQASLVLIFADSAGHALPIDNSPCSSIAWTSGAEFRACDPSGDYLGGDYPTQKNVMTGGEQWIFNDAGIMTGVSGTPLNLGANDPYAPGSAAPLPDTNPSLQQSHGFLGVYANFLAPVQGSLAAAAYGDGMFIGGIPEEADDHAFINFPVLEMQWAGNWMVFGQASGGVNFFADISNVAVSMDGSITTFDFHLHASEYIDASEDPLGIGFEGWTFQWELQGQGVYTSSVPVPAAVWLFCSGLLGLLGIARRKAL